MADQLYLSYRLRDDSARNVLRLFERLLRIFPYSRLSGGASTLRVNGVSHIEPPLFEKSFDDPPELEAMLHALREFACADCGFYLETRWDLWQYEADWRLSPARVTLAGFAPGFDSGADEHIRVEFGRDALFLPDPELPNGLFMARSNIRSLLHLVHELDREFAVDDRRLWTESGENFAERLKAALTDQV